MRSRKCGLPPPPLWGQCTPKRARGLQGRARRTVTLSTKITPRELELISAASEADGRPRGEWVREAVLKAARSSSIALRADHLMTEIVALQLFLTDVLSPVACGERISAEQYQELMQHVKTNKQRAAREVIAQYVVENEEERQA
jgi:hypothetical protein